MSISDKKCRLINCDKRTTPKSAKGYCPGHYNRLLKGVDVRAEEPLGTKNKRVKCAISYCENLNCSTRISKIYCSKHVMRLAKGNNPHEKTSKDRRPSTIEGGVAKIELGFKARHGYAIVDIDFSYLDKYNWNLSSSGYAFARPSGRTKMIYMHHLVLPRVEGMDNDHINRNKLDNRLQNLRTVTRSQNLHNSMKSGASGYKGVQFNKNRGKWQTRLRGKSKLFADKHDAAEYYNIIAKKMYGEYAALNEIRR